MTPEWLEALLQQPATEQQMALLRSANLLHEDGLAQILDQAMRLARSDPGQARQLSLICAGLAQAAAAPSILPRATYLRAQTHASMGEFDTALELIQSARAGYEALGQTTDALRTHIGLMHVLNEMGRHAEALDTGQAVLDALIAHGDSHPQAALLAALAHQNRGICFETIGRYRDALHEYALAEAGFTGLQMVERAGDIRNNRGIVLVHLGRVTEALQAFESAVQIWAEAGLALLQAQTLSNIGEAHLVLGNYTRSLSAFEHARRLLEPLDAAANQRILLRKTADAYLALNLYAEALGLYREAALLLKHTGMTDHRARALWGLGATLVAQAQLDEAQSVLAEAASLFAAAGNIPMRCSVMLEQAALQDTRGDRQSAIQTAHDALALVSREEWPVQRIYACLRLADLILPETAAAEPYLLEAQQLARPLGLPVLSYRLSSRLGRLHLLQGRDSEAQAYLEAALAQIETLRGHLAQESLRTSFLRDKTMAYEDLIALHLARGAAESVCRAFAVAEQAKSRTLVDLLTGVIPSEELASDDPALTPRLHTLRADLHAAYNRLLEPTADPRSTSLPELQTRATNLEREISRLQLRAGSQAAAPETPSPTLTSGNSQLAQLPTGLSLVAYHVVEDEIMAFLHDSGEVQVVRGLSRTAVVQQLLQRLNAQWDRFRAGGGFAGRHMAVLEKSAQRILAALYAELVAPLDFWLQPRASAAGGAPAGLAIVPHGILHQVPFHALFDGQRYLLDAFVISYAPSVTVLALCQQRQHRKARQALVMGVADAAIPRVTVEAQTVARELRVGQVLAEERIGGQATLQALNTLGPGCDILHLGCHGLFRADNPMFSALKFHDGWLTAADSMRLWLDGALVTLSACESGRSTVILGDEVIGLPRAFLAAGASAVVVSLWLVHDESTADFMAHWYRQLHQGTGRATALRAAQQALRERYPHPWYWAPFILIGQR